MTIEKLTSMDKTEIVGTLIEKYGDSFLNRNIDRTLRNIEIAKNSQQEGETESFEYTFYPHLLELLGPKHEMYCWFIEECTGIQPKTRRKALVFLPNTRIS